MQILNLDNRSLRWLLAELVIVVLGIMIAFQFENWRQERVDRQGERILLIGTLRNLETELSNISRVREHYQFQYDATIRLASNISNVSSSSAAEIAQNFTDSVFGTYFFITAPTYRGARDSGALSLISDSQLLNEFNFYFDTRGPFVERALDYISSSRDAFAASSARDVYTSPSRIFEGIEEFEAIEVILRTGETYFVILNTDLEQIPQNIMFDSSLSSLSARLNVGINQLNQLEEETRKLIASIETYSTSI